MAETKFSNSKFPSRPKKYMVIDIEVIPEKFENQVITEYLMDKNFPRKIHPLFSRVILIGYKLENCDTELLYPKNETELLKRFWGKIDELKPGLVVTFNGFNFDIPFLQIRSHINGVSPTMDINLSKWKTETSNHFDCMQVLSSNQTFLNVALDISCQVFKIPVPEPRVHGEEIPKLYQAGELETIKEHCRQDVELIEELYLKLRG